LLPRLSRRGQIGAAIKEPSPDDRDAVLSRVKSSLMTVEVCLGRTRISVGGLIKLEAGDVLVMDRRRHDPLEVIINGEVKFTGVPGRLDRRRAVKLIHRVREEEKYIYSDQ